MIKTSSSSDPNNQGPNLRPLPVHRPRRGRHCGTVWSPQPGVVPLGLVVDVLELKDRKYRWNNDHWVKFRVSPTLGLVGHPTIVNLGCNIALAFQGWVGPAAAADTRYALVLRVTVMKRPPRLCVIDTNTGREATDRDNWEIPNADARCYSDRRWAAVIQGTTMALWNFDGIESGKVRTAQGIALPWKVHTAALGRESGSLVVAQEEGVGVMVIDLESSLAHQRLIGSPWPITDVLHGDEHVDGLVCWKGMAYALLSENGGLLCLTTGQRTPLPRGTARPGVVPNQTRLVGGPYYVCTWFSDHRVEVHGVHARDHVFCIRREEQGTNMFFAEDLVILEPKDTKAHYFEVIHFSGIPVFKMLTEVRGAVWFFIIIVANVNGQQGNGNSNGEHDHNNGGGGGSRAGYCCHTRGKRRGQQQRNNMQVQFGDRGPPAHPDPAAGHPSAAALAPAPFAGAGAGSDADTGGGGAIGAGAAQGGREYSFVDLKEVLTAADLPKQGDTLPRFPVRDERLREAARSVLSHLTVQHIYETPLLDVNGEIDDVMRVNYDVDLATYESIKHLTLGNLKDHFLKSSGMEILRIGKALTGVHVAALAKLMDIHELIFVSKKLKSPTKARTCIGIPGTLSSRLQPNHPVDDLDGIKLLTYTGLSMGMGDCMFGVNPAIDTVEGVGKILLTLDSIRREFQVPTQICTLGHIKTQLKCLEQGYPVEILFQSLAGTDKTIQDEFGISVALLDQAFEVSYGANNGIDMMTCEALAYGLARRYSPFMVNSVTGFIGPETHANNHQLMISCLQDLFCGKVMGLPMGMDPGFTIHCATDREGQQIAVQLLTAAGVTFYMDVFLGCDRMLAYFNVSGHDNQTLRETYGLKPAPEFCSWAENKGIFRLNENGEVERGPNWGNPLIFCKSEEEFTALQAHLPQNYGFQSSGPRPANDVALEVRANEALARDAVLVELDMNKFPPPHFCHLETIATSKETHLRNPKLGAQLTERSKQQLLKSNLDVQIIIADGLSAEAIHYNVPVFLPLLENHLNTAGISLCAPHIVVRYGRVKLVEEVCKYVGSRITCILVGERPGGSLETSRSMSAYVALNRNDDPGPKFEYTVVSNIYAQGMDPLTAAKHVATTIQNILRHNAAGNRLVALMAEELKS
ncbi:ethanolamine ammonia-lyase [Pelomyxa schiedti]|nr:ethanolamine ammonia-lyase [Pelomyxa schiedti]